MNHNQENDQKNRPHDHFLGEFFKIYCSTLCEERCYELKDDGVGKPQVEEKYVARKLSEIRSTGIQAMDEFVIITGSVLLIIFLG